MAVPVQNILLRVPEILLRVIHLPFLLLPLFQRSETFPFRVSAARGFRGLAADEERGASDQANKLKMLHVL